MTSIIDKGVSWTQCAFVYAGKIPDSLIGLLARIGMAGIFWKSAMTKIAMNDEVSNFSLAQVWNAITFDWTIADSTYLLFEYEYALPILPVDLAATLATLGEIFLPLLLILGLATRFAAAGMLAMTLVIQIFVYPNLWDTHAIWATGLLFLIAKGAGLISLDHLIGKKFAKS